MKYLKNILAAIVTLGVFSVPALAIAKAEPASLGLKTDTAEVRGARGEMRIAREEVSQAISDRKPEIASQLSGLNKEERRAKIVELRSDMNAKHLTLVGSFIDRASDLFGATADRMSNFADRVDALIKRFETQHTGLNLTDAKNDLADAKTKIALIKSSLAKLGSDADAIILNAKDAIAAFKDIKNLIHTFKNEKIVPAHQALIKALTEVKVAADTTK